MTPPERGPALHAERAGQAGTAGPDLVLLHGFTQTGRLWGPFGETLAGRHRLVLVDLPGHGGSGDVRADLPSAAELVLAAAAAPDSPPFDLLGYSLGARVALHLALAHPDRVRRLVLIGATGGIEDDEARRGRRQRDEAAAAALEASGDVEGFLSRWLAAPMFAGLPSPGLEERRRNTAAGLASSLRLAGTGTQEPLWGRLGELTVPVLALAGADDPRFVAAGVRLSSGVLAGVFSAVPGAGHAAHLHQPALTARMVEAFVTLDGLAPGGSEG